MRNAVVALLLAALTACSGGSERPARRTYNEGVTLLHAQAWDEAEAKLLAARSEAGVDPELRWRAAFQLGTALAGHAEQVAAAQPPELERAIELYGKAAAWFQDAARLRPDDLAAAENLEIVRLRQQSLADQLGAGEKVLEARLDKLIEGQRALRDQARQLVEATRASGAANPAALAEAAGTLAVTERVLLTDAGVVVDLAGLEIDGIGAKAEDERSDEEKVRLVQLQNLDLWMQIARTALADARRLLDETRVDDAHGRADGAVDSLKRAREQLLDPIAVLRLIAADQLALAQQTDYLEQAEASKLQVGAEPAEAAAAVPAWLTTTQLEARQRDARSRLDELDARFKAAVEGWDAQQAAADPAAPAPDDGEAAAQARTMTQVKEALPDVDAAAAAMHRAQEALVQAHVAEALVAQREALEALARVIERFLDIKAVVDTAWQEQQAVVALLGDPAALPPEVAALPPAEKSRQVGERVARNVRRMQRVEGLLADEALAIEQQLAQAQAQAQGGSPDAAAGAEQQAEAARQRITRAGELRGQALAALEELARGGKRAPLEVAGEALARIDELRQLYFSLIEHLEELIRQQGETRDRTTEAHGLDDLGRAPLLGGLVQRQTEHQGMAQEIGEALAQQADQLAQAPAQPAAPGQPDPAEQARVFGQAAEEVRAAVAAMVPALDTLGKAQTAAQSVDLAPVLDDQQQALEHLAAALRLLQPPPPQDQQQQDQQQQDQQQQDQQQQQQQDQQEQSAERRRERVREQEAQRRREREQRPRAGDDPVERDW